MSRDHAWDLVLSRLQVEAGAAGQVDWSVSVDSTVVRVHHHGATAARSAADTSARTGGRRRTTRIRLTRVANRAITASAGPAAG